MLVDPLAFFPSFLAICLTLAGLMGGAQPLQAQVESVAYDYELNRLVENQPLPSEHFFTLTGAVPEDVNLVEVRIYPSGRARSRKPLEVSTWREPFTTGARSFSVPMNYALMAGKHYDLVIDYFEPVGAAEKRALYSLAQKYVDAYLARAFELRRNRIRLVNRSKQTYRELNTLVRQLLERYRSLGAELFPGFSDLVRLKIDEADGVPTTYEYQSLAPDSLADAGNIAGYFPDELKELRQFIHAELQFAINRELVVRSDSRLLENYPTTRKEGYFGLNIGYGAVNFSNPFANEGIEYDAEPYIGLVFPFTTSAVAAPFWKKAGFAIGVFLRNMEDAQGRTMTGPVIQRPFYAGLDYKLFSFVHLDLGAAFLERANQDNGQSPTLLVRPYLGISGRFNISLSLAK